MSRITTGAERPRTNCAEFSKLPSCVRLTGPSYVCFWRMRSLTKAKGGRVVQRYRDHELVLRAREQAHSREARRDYVAGVI